MRAACGAKERSDATSQRHEHGTPPWPRGDLHVAEARARQRPAPQRRGDGAPVGVALERERRLQKRRHQTLRVRRGVSPDLFSPQWFSGVSVVSVPAEVAEPLLREPARRAAALKRLVAAIPSEMNDVDLQVGPELDGDSTDRDVSGWVAGFDSPSCSVGLYSARQSRAPDTGMNGMSRAHSAYFLVCKAGGGTAATTFTRASQTRCARARRWTSASRAAASPGPPRCAASPRRASATVRASWRWRRPPSASTPSTPSRTMRARRRRRAAAPSPSSTSRPTCCASSRASAPPGSTAPAASTRA